MSSGQNVLCNISRPNKVLTIQTEILLPINLEYYVAWQLSIQFLFNQKLLTYLHYLSGMYTKKNLRLKTKKALINSISCLVTEVFFTKSCEGSIFVLGSYLLRYQSWTGWKPLKTVFMLILIAVQHLEAKQTSSESWL